MLPIPNNRAAVTYSRSRKVKVSAYTTRAIVGQQTKPKVRASGQNPRPTTVTIVTAIIKYGNEIPISITRLKIIRSRLRFHAALTPSVIPMKQPSKVPTVPIPNDHLKPAITREYTSWPSASVPSNAPPRLGDCKRKLRSEAAGSTV